MISETILLNSYDIYFYKWKRKKMKKTLLLSLLATGAFFVSWVTANTTWAVATWATTTTVSTGIVLTATVSTGSVTTWAVTTGAVVTTGTVVLSWSTTLTGTLLTTTAVATTDSVATWATLSWDETIQTLLSNWVEMTWAKELSLPTLTGATITWTVISTVDAETLAAGELMFKEKITKLSVENTDFSANLLRWEAALLLKRVAVEKLWLTGASTTCTFKDIDSLDKDTAKEISDACAYGLFKGKDSKFMPNTNFTRGQAIIVLARMISQDANLELDDAYDFLLNAKIINVDDRKESGRSVSRSELYIMISRILTQKAEGTLPKAGSSETQQLINLMEGLLQK